MRRLLSAVTAAAVLAVGCGRQQSYPLKGQVTAIEPGRLQITIRHQAVPGLMDAMTMPFAVDRSAPLDPAIVPGDLISATLVVEQTRSYVTSIVRVGNAPLPEAVPAALESDVVRPGDAVPDVQLVDQTGAPRKLSEWRGKTVALTFIYTRCPLPDFCPRMNRQFIALQSALAGEPALRDRTKLISISLDPDHDSPTALGTFARGVGADPALWTFATGTRDAVDHFAVPFGIYVVRDPKTGSITHNLRTAVIRADGRLLTLFSGGNWTIPDLLAALRQDR